MLLPGIGSAMPAVAAQDHPTGPTGSPTTLATSSTNTFTMGYPANPKAGDYALFWVSTMANAGLSISTGPSGFTLLATSSSGFIQCYLYYRKLDGTESGNVTLTLSGSTGANNNAYGSLTYWTGLVQSGTVFDGGTIQTAGNSANGVGTAFTPSVANELVLTLWGCGTTATDRNSTPSTGWTNVLGDTWTLVGGSTTGGKAPIDSTVATGGTVAAETRTFNSSSITFWISCTIGMRPA